MNRIMRKLIASIAAFSMLATLGLTSVSAAAPAPATESSRAREILPLVAAASGSFTFIDPSNLHLVGSGIGTPLGKFTTDGTITFLGPASCEGGFKIHDEVTLSSTRNNDKISLEIDDEACPTDTPNVYRIVGQYNVTGGAGSFAGARGQGIAICIGDFNNNTFKVTWVGSVSRSR